MCKNICKKCGHKEQLICMYMGMGCKTYDVNKCGNCDQTKDQKTTCLICQRKFQSIPGHFGFEETYSQVLCSSCEKSIVLTKVMELQNKM